MKRSVQVSSPFVRSEIVTSAAISGIIDLATRRGARAIVIGHTASSGSAEAAAELARGWWARGGSVIDSVDLTAKGGTFIRAALAFTQVDPDLWIITDTPSRWSALAHELTIATGWQSQRTLALSSGDDSWSAAAAGDVLDGVTGVDAQGRAWSVRDGRLLAGPTLG